MKKIKYLFTFKPRKNFFFEEIQNLSQIFIVNTDLDDAYFPIPLDVNIQLDNNGTHIMGNDGKVYKVNYPQKAKLTYLDNKSNSVKNSYPLIFGNNSFWSSYFNKEPIFINGLYHFEKNEQQYHGMFIAKEKFDSKTSYQLNENFLFASIFEIDKEIVDKLSFDIKIVPYDQTKLQNHSMIRILFNKTECNFV